MKKIFPFFVLFTVILIALGAGSCILEPLEYDITVKNRCGHEIKVTLSKSTSTPDSFTTIRNGSSAVFSVGWADYYPHIKSDNYTFWSYHPGRPIKIESNGTLIITYDGFGYDLEYYR